MKFRPTHHCARCAEQAGFTLAEVLAALVFMAIVIPVAVQGLRIASLAGQVADRKSTASRIADRLLNEAILNTQNKSASQSGYVQDGAFMYRWQLRNEPWQLDAIHALTLTVSYDVQGEEHDVRLTTLIDNTLQQ